MTTQHSQHWPYFVISIVRTDTPDKLRKLYKRFVTKYSDELQKADLEHKMFRGTDFKELKGAMFSPPLKRAFTETFCDDSLLELYYIMLDNKRISEKLYENTARAFNYTLKLAFEYFLKNGYLPDDEYSLQLDERNERTDTKHFLQNYLNTELRMKNVLSKDITVQYFDSSSNRLIQIADVFANLYYSQLRTNNYEQQFKLLKETGCLKMVFRFPL